METRNALAGASFMGIVVVSYVQARMQGGSFPQEAEAAYFVGRRGVVAAAPRVP